MGWIAWEPERSRSRPRESKPVIGSPVEHGPWPRRHPPTFRERERKLRDTNREVTGDAVSGSRSTSI
jgi:hypothetical protein